jgi:hypothetical protein
VRSFPEGYKSAPTLWEDFIGLAGWRIEGDKAIASKNATLWGLAKQLTGEGTDYTKLTSPNGDPGTIYPGDVVDISPLRPKQVVSSPPSVTAGASSTASVNAELVLYKGVVNTVSIHPGAHRNEPADMMYLREEDVTRKTEYIRRWSFGFSLHATPATRYENGILRFSTPATVDPLDIEGIEQKSTVENIVRNHTPRTRYKKAGAIAAWDNTRADFGNGYCVECAYAQLRFPIETIDNKVAAKMAQSIGRIIVGMTPAKPIAPLITAVSDDVLDSLITSKNTYFIAMVGVICADGKRNVAVANAPRIWNEDIGGMDHVTVANIEQMWVTHNIYKSAAPKSLNGGWTYEAYDK